jgi:hypothetical protein
MPLDIYKGQWSKISKIKQSSKLILQIERDLVHLNVMPSHVQVISIPIPDTVVTPAVDVGTFNVRTNPAAHLVDAATPTVTPKDDAPYQYNKYKKGDTSRKPRKCFACHSTIHLYADCQDPRKAIMAKERMTLLQKQVRAAGKSRDFSRNTHGKLGKHLTTQHILSSMTKRVYRNPLKKLMLPALVLRPFRLILTIRREWILRMGMKTKLHSEK